MARETCGTTGGTAPDSALLDTAVAALAAGQATTADWCIRAGDLWVTVLPGAHVPRMQGWKIHVSAASGAAVEVLSRVVGVAARRSCAFKFATGPRQLATVNSADCDRGSSGKFITLYPDDDAHFASLAEALHTATAGLPGPVIPSDRPYRPGSRVHYRYGAFAGRPELSPDGLYRTMLTGPDGRRTEDLRSPRFAPPPWACAPLNQPPPATPERPTGRAPVLLAGRYALSGALRRSAKGGVFAGTDTATGERVVVKQALPHIEVDGPGPDACAALRHEAEMLERLTGAGLAPRPLELVEHDGRLFLVREEVPGPPLSHWVSAALNDADAPDAPDGPGVPWPVAAPLAEALVRLLTAVHDRGIVLGDLAPGNVIVRPDGAVRVIDLETAAVCGQPAGRSGTPGYRAPERTAVGAQAADPRSDLFALGGLLFLQATGHNPPPPDDAGGVPRMWLSLAARTGETARRLAPVIAALRRTVPAERPPLSHVLTSLGRGRERLSPTRTAMAPTDDARFGRAITDGMGYLSDTADLDDAPFDRVIADGVRYLAETADPDRAERLWPTTPSGLRTDPCNVQHGAAGVLAVLVRAAETATLPEDVGSTALATTRTAADWIVRRLATDQAELPGLHFGRAGTAWALRDAAVLLDDPALARYADDLALRLPVRWPNPDVCHGAAGAGFTHLRMAAGRPGTPFPERVRQCAQGLVDAGRPVPEGVLWPVPEDFDSAFAGRSSLGYAHGVAGIGAFLLAAARATGECVFHDAAVRAGRTLAATARRENSGEGPGRDGPAAAWWPQCPGDPEPARSVHWCSGSSGIGTFLVRLWQATGEATALDLALAAGEAVLRARWRGTTAACHGLAGEGEFLLDLAQATDSPRFLTGARMLATLLTVRSTTREGLCVPLDETGYGCGAGYGTGISGALAFLLRLRHGGTRLWADPVPVPLQAPVPPRAPDMRLGPDPTAAENTPPHTWRHT
ncbi:class IV lanthionine synthetase LanL [Streptomyces sirii]|uniref:class IV lanthionine synthetase LanL n=1 Tax=Streptomyces sirii TaxID=3127701 RepID=UPI003D366973